MRLRWETGFLLLFKIELYVEPLGMFIWGRRFRATILVYTLCSLSLLPPSFSFEFIRNFMASTSDICYEERTYIMVKPDGVQRGLIADIMKRFEQRGYKLIGLKMIQVLIKRCS